VDQSELAAGSVISGKLGPNAVGTSNIAPSAVDQGQLAPDSVRATHIYTSAVGNDELATDSVNTAELIADSVTTAKIADLQVTTNKLANDAVTGAKVSNGSLTAQDIAGSAPGGPLAGQVTIDPPSIAANQCYLATIGLSGVQVGDHVTLNAVTPQTANDYRVEALTGVANNLRVQFCNNTAAPLDPSSADYSYLAIHP
jgi:hypothetical protein